MIDRARAKTEIFTYLGENKMSTIRYPNEMVYSNGDDELEFFNTNANELQENLGHLVKIITTSDDFEKKIIKFLEKQLETDNFHAIVGMLNHYIHFEEKTWHD